MTSSISRSPVIPSSTLVGIKIEPVDVPQHATVEIKTELECNDSSPSAPIKIEMELEPYDTPPIFVEVKIEPEPITMPHGPSEIKTEAKAEDNALVSIKVQPVSEVDNIETKNKDSCVAVSAQTLGAYKQRIVDGETTSRRQSETATQAAQSPHQCNICQRQFTQTKDMIIHYRTHTGKKLFPCNQCGLRFYRNYDLLRHVRTHSGEKTFQCNECGRRLSQKCSLISHIKTHTLSSEKPHQCHECDRTFKTKGELSRHSKTHAKLLFECTECDHRFTFTRKCDFLAHMRIHTGEQPYQCRECGCRFNQRSSLLVHMRTHTGEKPFQCEVCQRVFVRQRNLSSHMKIHQ